ncbi:3-keto-5-aminohexanoate cleavage protein [Candidatus Micrarchaeota archaeon]|nr:3-keto-5-aminohexanoate cleavage protein [Candidatus Micrarchaeota archaeon]MBU1681951.1 3-keto-5-aminohexanoate cleavage protein [Candidatus Micrarchaeota archaeon]
MMLQKNKLIIHSALTGNVPTKTEVPNIPITPDEIISDARKCFAAGATYFHIHARGEDGKPSCKKEIFEEIMSGVRKHCPGSVICITAGGRVFKTFEERSAILDLEGELKPEFASLTLGSINFPEDVSVNSPHVIQELAKTMLSKGIRPELEIFDTGMLNYAAYLTRKGILKSPFHFNLFFGLLGTMPARMVDLCHLVQSLPQNSTWAAAGGGKFQLSVNTAAILMGGHVRTGLEDNFYYDLEKKIPATNEALVGRIAKLATELGRPIANASETRAILKL